MKKHKVIILSVKAIIPVIPLALMFASAHNGDVAYTCAMGFLALYMCVYAMLHDVNVSLFNLVCMLISFLEAEGDENDLED